MLLKRVKHYRQWLRSAIPIKTQLGQFSSDCIRIQGPSKRPSSGRLYPVSAVKEHNRKGGKCKISRVLQSPVSCTLASSEVEAGNRPKQAQCFSTRRKVQNGNSRVHQDLPDSRGMGIVDRSIRRLPTHPHTSALKEVPKILPQVSGVPVHLPPLQTVHSPPGFHNDCERSEAYGPHQRSQTSPISGRLADQVTVSGGSPLEHSGSGRSNPVLGVDHKSGKVRTEAYSGVLVRGLQIPPRFSPSREMAQTSGFDPTTQVKTCFDCKMFDVSNWVAASMEKMVPEGHLHIRPFQFHLKEHWRYPQLLDSLLPWTEMISAHLDWLQNPANVMKGSDLHPKDHSIHLTDASNDGRGSYLDQNSANGLWSKQEKRLHINVLELKADWLQNPANVMKGSDLHPKDHSIHKCFRIEGDLTGPPSVQGPVSKPNSSSCNRQLSNGSLYQQTRRNSLRKDVCAPVENHDVVPSLSHNIEGQTHSRVPQCDGQPPVQAQSGPIDRMVTTPTGVQADLSKVVHPSHRPVCHSSEPQTPSIHVSYPRPKGLGYRCSKH